MKRRSISLAGGLIALAALATPVAAGGPPGQAFYVDGDTYRTVGTPTNLFDTGAPADTYDLLYAVPGQLAVSASAPGDTDYNGGRWLRFPVTWNVEPYLLTSEGAVLDAALLGDITIASEPDAAFVCPVIPG
jgi:hypothetical protein